MGIGVTLLVLTNAKWYSVLVTFSTLLVSTSFAFGDSLSRIVLSLSFIFLTKPYEVGDGIAFNGQEPPIFYVEKINVFSTSFRTPHNRRMVYPNWLLSETSLYNLSRNKISKHDLFFEISFSISKSVLKKIKKEIAKWLKNHSDSYSQDFWFVASNTSISNSLQLQIRIGLKNAFDQSLINANRRSDFLLFFRDLCMRHGVSYKYLTKPIDLTTDSDIATPADLSDNIATAAAAGMLLE
jgi:small-conductance mechanosensitive channel